MQLEYDTARKAAASDLTSARMALAAAPVAVSPSPVASAIGVKPELASLVMAILRSLMNLVGTVLIVGAMAKFRWHALEVGTEDPSDHVQRFSTACFMPLSGARVTLAEMLHEYREWCAERCERSLPEQVFVEELARQVQLARLPVERSPEGRVIVRNIAPIRLIEAQGA